MATGRGNNWVCPRCHSTHVWSKSAVRTQDGLKRRAFCVDCAKTFYPDDLITKPAHSPKTVRKTKETKGTSKSGAPKSKSPSTRNTKKKRSTK